VLRNLWRHRYLLVSLVRRQYQLRYRQSLVGIMWALVPPLATLGVGTILFDRIINLDTSGEAYPVFAMAALVPWTFFANSLNSGVPSIASNLLMVTRLAFPRSVLPLSMIGLAFLDLLVASAAFVVVAFIFGDGLPLTALWAPALLLVLVPLTAGIVLLGSAVNVFARDIRLAVPLFVQLWLFLTPVLYGLPPDASPGVRTLYLANPMTGIVRSFRRVLVFGGAPDLQVLLPSIAGAVILLVVGIWYFRSTEPRFADVV
jgi:lipopolysaccharide transport system permease protein